MKEENVAIVLFVEPFLGNCCLFFCGTVYVFFTICHEIALICDSHSANCHKRPPGNVITEFQVYWELLAKKVLRNYNFFPAAGQHSRA